MRNSLAIRFRCVISTQCVFNLVSLVVFSHVGNYFKRIKYYGFITRCIARILVFIEIIYIFFLLFIAYDIELQNKALKVASKSTINTQMKKYLNNITSMDYMNMVQAELRCCGNSDYRDWAEVLEAPGTRSQ